ncbi:hypothetical protein [Acinetobacter modestus]|uniref:hypothetical protein n=1 Tax=Acinetobacter modestus TaxID=1776740 RepID=UPI001F4A5FE2|nr:hypothetical protein [Acinetobacter modestus]MCH7330566.1 hypothetical protein [Acinetobacter modestus]
MNNILNAQEAFAALQKGKTVLCRYAGNGNLHADKNFSTLDQMPATVFVLPNYEFCVQVEMLELAGIKFTKPLTIDEIEQGQDVFLIQPHAVILQYKFNDNIDELVDGIHSGFVQRDFENAQLQYKAFCEAVGGTPIQVNLELAEQPKKKRSRKSTEQNEASESKQQTNDDTSLDDILGPVGIQSPSPNTADPELSVLCDAFITEIDAAVSDQDLKAIRTRINSNGDLTEVESAELETRINLKSASFEKEQSLVPFENIAAAAVAKAKKVDVETQQKNENGHYFDQVKKETAAWNEQLQKLLKDLETTKTPEEANSLVSQTMTWTKEQREPLLRAISRRLQHFQNPQAKENPSISVQIRNATDLTTLDSLEIDVSTLDPIIQPDMMRLITSRRLQLESAANNGGHAS